MPRKIAKTAYIGRCHSQKENVLNNTPIIVDAAKFTLVDLSANACNSCMPGTMEYAAKQNDFEIPETAAKTKCHVAQTLNHLMEKKSEFIYQCRLVKLLVSLFGEGAMLLS